MCKVHVHSWSSTTCSCCSISSYSTRRAINSGGHTVFLGTASWCLCHQWVRPDCTTCLLWKFNPWKFKLVKISAKQLIVISWKFCLTKNLAIWYFMKIECNHSTYFSLAVSKAKKQRFLERETLVNLRDFGTNLLWRPGTWHSQLTGSKHTRSIHKVSLFSSYT